MYDMSSIVTTCMSNSYLVPGTTCRSNSYLVPGTLSSYMLYIFASLSSAIKRLNIVTGEGSRNLSQHSNWKRFQERQVPGTFSSYYVESPAGPIFGLLSQKAYHLTEVCNVTT